MRLFLVASIFLVAVGVLVGVGVVASSIPVLKLGELRGAGARYEGRAVQLDRGKVVSIDRLFPLRFRVAEEGDSTAPLVVVSKLSPPENFKVGTDVMIQGTYDLDSREFSASTIMTKCPSRYEATEEFKKAQDREAAMESLRQPNGS